MAPKKKKKKKNSLALEEFIMGYLLETEMVLSSPSRWKLMAYYAPNPGRDRKTAAGKQIWIPQALHNAASFLMCFRACGGVMERFY